MHGWPDYGTGIGLANKLVIKSHLLGTSCDLICKSLVNAQYSNSRCPLRVRGPERALVKAQEINVSQNSIY
jgi:hypothetical protein